MGWTAQPAHESSEKFEARVMPPWNESGWLNTVVRVAGLYKEEVEGRC